LPWANNWCEAWCIPLDAHVEMARRIADTVVGDDVPECGHMSTMERQGAIVRALLDWPDS
jgi:pimeloyl-ACP methyl ester carboxylesterase